MSNEIIEDEPTNENDEHLQLLYALRFFQKKSINGGLTVYDVMAIDGIKRVLKQKNITFTESEIMQLPSLSQDSYLSIMQAFCSQDGLLLEFDLTGDIDKDLKLCQFLLNKLKTTPATQIDFEPFLCQKRILFDVMASHSFPKQNKLMVIQPNVDGFSVVMAKYLIVLINRLEAFLPKRIIKERAVLVREAPNKQDSTLKPYDFLTGFEHSHIFDVQKTENKAPSNIEQSVYFDVNFNYQNNAQGLFVYLDYKGGFDEA